MTLQCVILAGGLGTRMRPLTEIIPKPLIPVRGIPFVDWQLRRLAGQGVRDVLFSIGYRGEMLRDHLGDGSRFGLRVTYVDDGARLRGTGGALRLALDEGALGEAFFVLYGDSYLPISMPEVERAWRRSRLPALMTVLRNENRWDSSNAAFAGGLVTLYDKRPAEEIRDRLRWIDYGLSILTRAVVAEAVSPGAPTDLADVFRDLSRAGRLAGLEVRERFYEAGSPEGLRYLEDFLAAADPSVWRPGP